MMLYLKSRAWVLGPVHGTGHLSVPRGTRTKVAVQSRGPELQRWNKIVFVNITLPLSRSVALDSYSTSLCIGFLFYTTGIFPLSEYLGKDRDWCWPIEDTINNCLGYLNYSMRELHCVIVIKYKSA